ncbi:MAG: hypothetical protein Q8P28_05640 [Deltaproteobacteria bacterium]|nr:hypothetical protein [Deltaproteobacteria bacterium]
MPIERKLIEASLRKKGFIQEGGDHKYFYHEVNGKRTGAYAFVSRGSGYKTYDDNLLSAIKKELRLDTLRETRDLLQCPMSGDEYNSVLREKGILNKRA